ncbi:tannase/feruloyl esterase family alpha/beta hydrolase [Sinorhizobium sp. 7-81]|nr:tannase/feruloyl esterase family alpha/beta hydrolase [Sinorhizobium sp. 8-89]MDK1494105.1 tannase/feruloyl esterase family alpha/beta hydrolase [Sinorhizobium sp. 8-89]
MSSDAGHDGSARFGFDPEARRHYGYGAVKLLQPVAKAMTEAYYGRKVEFTYGVRGVERRPACHGGCSANS